MRTLFQWFLFSIVLVGLADHVAMAQTTATAAPATEPVPARALTARGGIPNAAAKLKAGQDVTVAFLGGPITGGGGDRGFPELVARWLRVQYPAVLVRVVNAGFIDGGSPLGAARYERDVLPHKPDLLFVEFAADDAGKEDRRRHVERIVHKAWTNDPTLDVVFLYAMDEEHREAYRAATLPPTAAEQDRLAEHYGIPSIVLGLDLLTRVDAGNLRWVELFYDRSRPTPAGHAAYGDAIIAGLQTLLSADAPPATPIKHELKAPLTADLVVRPATRPATAMPAPAPMTDDAGRKAEATYAMPIIGTHWVGSPEFVDADGRVLWRLLSQSARENGRRLNAAVFGVDRTRWGPPMSWFEEWSYFTGPAGVYLAHSTNGKTNNLTARENDLPIVTFTAPRAGRYRVRVTSTGAAMWGLHNALAMNVVHFPVGQTKGTSIAFHKTRTRVVELPDIEVDVTLAEGDDLAFELDTNATGGGGGAAYLETDITVGWFGDGKGSAPVNPKSE